MPETKKSVLVVDDEPDLVRIVKTILEGQGYEVQCAYDGLEVFRCLEERVPDVLVIDRIMPGMGGLEVIRKLKESPATASIPIIMLTSMDKFDDVTEGYQKGADVYITKPFTKAQVLNGINLALASRWRLSENDLKAHGKNFLKACAQLSRRTRELVEKFAAEEGLAPSAWLYKGLELRVRADQNRTGSLKAAPEWSYGFRGWGVNFQNSKTGETAELAIGPGGRPDTFDEWGAQRYIESEAARGAGFAELSQIMRNHSDAARIFIEHLALEGWIEPAKAKGEPEKDLDAQLKDRWIVSPKGARLLEKA